MTLDNLLAKWLDREGGAERANYQMFLSEFASALGLPAPEPKGAGLGDYEFEAPVRSEATFGKKGTHRIDLYKRGCFILEAKQSQLKPGETAPAEPAEAPPAVIYDLFGHAIGSEAPAKPAPRYDRLMADARLQAERYALALPGDHKAPPFLIVADIGRAFELYFDWTGNGRGYAPFPDERQYRIGLAELTGITLLPGLDVTAADLLRAIWTDPASVDPRLKAAEVTRDIAKRLSRVAAQLEKDERGRHPGRVEIAMGIEATSLFLMRTLFCMFAEDVELLPKDSFKSFLEEAQRKSAHFWRNGLTDLWSRMNDPQEANRYWPYGDAIVRYFNGNLFQGTRIFDLPDEFKNELLVAAGKDWRKVEPAIFGTLLEQVLTTADRAKLGAHYTPRAYVERLVDATMLEVLRPEWDAVREQARAALDPPRHGEGDQPQAGGGGGPQGSPHVESPLHHASHGPPPRAGEELKQALALVTAFHTRLADIRVLDPACGTGNFLYVAMEQLLRLEGEVRQFAAGLGADLPPTVHPNQFLGLELNPRAAVIAELVLWIGWLRYRLANTPDAIGEPVLPTLTNINFGTHGGYDAVVARTDTNEPDAANPRRPKWPAADFIIGNPPFIGGKDIRERLGGDYAEVLWKGNPRVAKSADFVMHWWDRAADILTRPDTRLKRFGFVTTNSITQVFSRRVIEAWLADENPPPPGGGGTRSVTEGEVSTTIVSNPPPPSPSAPPPPGGGGSDGAARGANVGKLHLVMAIADHPWTRVGDAAAVRIAMTVAEAGAGEGRLVKIASERAIDTDAPELAVAVTHGAINANLSTGTDVTSSQRLNANRGISHDGVKLHGKGFSISSALARSIGLGKRADLERYIRPYRNGRDLTGVPPSSVNDKFVIDFYGIDDERYIRTAYPEAYQYLFTSVREARVAQEARSSTTDAKAYLAKWWLLGKPRPELRPALENLSRYIATVDTAKHRVFQFIEPEMICDDKVVIIASEQAFHLGILQSQIHCNWVSANQGLLEDRPVYVKTRCFDPFPFPAFDSDCMDTITDVAEELDATRRTALSENPALTMTGLYNLVAAIRAGTLAEKDEAAAVKARARIVAKLHDDLDAAVAAAYGWADDWKRGDLTPAEIVARLVALNAERAGEEAAGQVRWLRPDYQIPRFSRALP